MQVMGYEITFLLKSRQMKELPELVEPDNSIAYI